MHRDGMFSFNKPAKPSIVWRNPAMAPRMRVAKYRTMVPGGRKYDVLERARYGDWVVVAVLTLIDGRRKVAA